MNITAERLTVVCCYYNPIRYESRRKLHKVFVDQMHAAGVTLVVVECQIGERPFEMTEAGNKHHVQVRCSTLVWNKENLINLGVQHASRHFESRYIGWFDADVHFRNPHWATDTIEALQIYDVVQPYSHCYDLGPNGEHLNVDVSFGHHWHHHRQHRGTCVPYFRHTGYAWACRRSALEKVGGLIDFAALGAGDHHMALALVGQVQDSVPKQMAASYHARLNAWQARVMAHNLSLGYVPGTIEHGFHGKKKDRRYIERWDILTKHKFDPDIDLKKNLFGVVELAGNKPHLRHDIDLYFRQRNEDLNAAW